MKNSSLFQSMRIAMLAALLAVCAGLVPCSLAAGRIVVAHDDLILADGGFRDPSDPGIFAQNVAAWFTGGRAGRFLAYTDNQGMTGASLINAMTSIGHAWIVSTDSTFTLSNLMTFDGIFLCGHPLPVDDLLAYVYGGGNVYLAGLGVADDDMTKWNPFLQHFGLGFTNQGTGVADFAVSSAHPIFAGVDHLYGVNGTSVVDLQPANPNNRVLIRSGEVGLFAVWGSEKSKLRIQVSQVELSWDSESNVTYGLQYRSALTTNTWLPLGTNCFPGDGSVIRTHDSVVVGEPQRFYRLVTNCVAHH